VRTNYTNAGINARTASANSTNREMNILVHMNLVPIVAKRLISRVPPCVTLDDLTSAGTIGLIQAVDRVDPKHAEAFRTYAKHRVLGAMLDYVRGDDPVSRTERSRIRRSQPDNASATISLDQFSDSFPALATKGVAPQSAIADRVDLAAARRSLTRRENFVVAMLFDRADPPAKSPKNCTSTRAVCRRSDSER
jgi:RNA polymerase sigma factor (sigma-70 family)